MSTAWADREGEPEQDPLSVFGTKQVLKTATAFYNFDKKHKIYSVQVRQKKL